MQRTSFTKLLSPYNQLDCGPTTASQSSVLARGRASALAKTCSHETLMKDLGIRSWLKQIHPIQQIPMFYRHDANYRKGEDLMILASSNIRHSLSSGIHVQLFWANQGEELLWYFECDPPVSTMI